VFYLKSFVSTSTTYSRNHLEITEFVDINNLSDRKEKGVEDMTRTLFLEKKREVWG